MAFIELAPQQTPHEPAQETGIIPDVSVPSTPELSIVPNHTEGRVEKASQFKGLAHLNLQEDMERLRATINKEQVKVGLKPDQKVDDLKNYKY